MSQILKVRQNSYVFVLENKEPKKRTFPPFTFYQPFEQIYRPADFHEDRIMTRVLKMLQNGTLVWLSNYEEGQFEDP